MCDFKRSVYVEQHSSASEFTTAESWVILLPLESSIRSKMRAQGVPLSEWNLSINYGIKTGFNDAFIVSTEKKDELIAEDPKSAEIIRPILRGRDIKRYNYTFANLWLLFVPWHFPMQDDESIKGASPQAERLFQQQYPAVYKHLLSYKNELSKRNKAETGIRYEWYALQRWGAKYWNDFFEQKIVWGNLCLSSQFALAEEGYFINAPSPMIVPGNKYVLSVLNSRLGDWYIRQLGVTRNGGYFEYKPMFVEQLPIPMIPENEQLEFIDLVDKVLLAKALGENTTSIEEEIDKLVYKLYGLTEEEILFITDP